MSSLDEEAWWEKSNNNHDDAGSDSFNSCGKCMKWFLFLLGLGAMCTAVFLAIPDNPHLIGVQYRHDIVYNSTTYEKTTVNVLFNPFYVVKYGLKLEDKTECAIQKPTQTHKDFLTTEQNWIILGCAAGYALFLLLSMIMVCCERVCISYVFLLLSLGCAGVTVWQVSALAGKLYNDFTNVSKLQDFVCSITGQESTANCFWSMAENCKSIGGSAAPSGWKIPALSTVGIDIDIDRDLNFYAEWAMVGVVAGLVCIILYLVLKIFLFCPCCRKSEDDPNIAI